MSENKVISPAMPERISSRHFRDDKQLLAELMIMQRIERMMKPLPAEAALRVGQWTMSMAVEIAAAKRKADNDATEGLL